MRQYPFGATTIRPRTSNFIAIGVGQGDAFFLERGSVSALVDGGRSAVSFPSQFSRTCRREGVNVLVCTHNDADHSLGIVGFLEAGLKCDEVWLPGSWTYRLEHLLRQPDAFTAELIRDVASLEASPEGRLQLETLGDETAVQPAPEETGEEVAAPELVAHLEASSLEIPLGIRFWLPPHAFSPMDIARSRPWTSQHFSLLTEALNAAERVRQIAVAAHHAGARIRWFEYDRSVQSGGIDGFLIPANSRELLRLRRRSITALAYLSLTVANRESLVFLSPRQRDVPAVLFTSDSALDFSQTIPWHNRMVVTAPHHGAESNKGAYERFMREARPGTDAIWIRSDGRFATRPGPSYLALRGRRYCTLCRNSAHGKQDVILSVVRADWASRSRPCHCPVVH